MYIAGLGVFILFALYNYEVEYFRHITAICVIVYFVNICRIYVV